MDCEQFDEVAIDLLYGELSDVEKAAEARRHMDSCSRCAALLEQLRAARRSGSLPRLEVPSGLDERILLAAKRAQREIPWPYRLGRWISWAGSYAMRPQLAMAALLMLMIGSSLLLLRGRPGSGQVGVVRITEQGVPDRDHGALGAEPSAADPSGSPSNLGSSAPTDSAAAPLGSEASLVPPADSAELGGKGSEGDGRSDGYAAAMTLYRTKSYAKAYRALDAVAAQGGPNAPSAALYAAKAVRMTSGCPNAMPRLETLASRHGSSAVGLEAKWELAGCARVVGSYQLAQQIYTELSKIEGQKERAERELARLGKGSKKGSPAGEPRRKKARPEGASAPN